MLDSTNTKTTKLLTLADYIESLPANAIAMDMYMSGCGTKGCIAGWAVYREYGIVPTRGVADIAEKLLEMTLDESGKLFFDYPYHVTQAKVVSVLRKFALTNVIDWS